MNSKLFAVIVSFRPNESLIELIDILGRHSIFVLVIANEDHGISRRILSSVPAGFSGEVMFNAKNMGIAYALNQALRYGIKNQFNKMITFDQDSLPLECYFDEIKHHEQFGEAHRNVAVVSPTLIKFDGSEIRTDSYFGSSDTGYFFVTTTVTSGSIFDLQALSSVGGFTDDFFIDYVDHDVCLKLRKFGYLAARSTNARLKHQIGTHRTIKVFGKNFSLTEYSPHRHYFIARNRILTYRRYIMFFPAWILRDAAISTVWTILTMTLEANRVEKVCNFALGLYHGVRGVTGNPGSFFVNAHE